VADVPGRCEPGTGEINYSAIAVALKEMSYSGTVGLEAYASGARLLGAARAASEVSGPRSPIILSRRRESEHQWPHSVGVLVVAIQRPPLHQLGDEPMGSGHRETGESADLLEAHHRPSL